MIQQERIQQLNSHSIRSGDYVLYWMQASQRILDNHALQYAIQKANEYRKHLVVFFGLTPSYPEANQRHYSFMLEGLKEIQQSLEKQGITFV
ncbi:MAG: phr, partial [Thermoplasmatales archaeon]|nr:phr [Thermoplasmatales archaeon]